MPYEFKKVNLPTFDGEIKKSKDVEAWFLSMKKFLRLNGYSENMRARVATFNLKGKANIWWGDVKNVRGIHEEDFIWNEFENLFKRK